MSDETATPETVTDTEATTSEPVQASVVDSVPDIRSASDRLRSAKPKQERVTFDDGLVVVVQGLALGDVLDMSDVAEDPDNPDFRAASFQLLRACVRDEMDTETHVFEDWTDEELLALPAHISNQLLTASNRVLGRTPEPGKE